jgi:hypothetical protein
MPVRDVVRGGHLAHADEALESRGAPKLWLDKRGAAER